jgi:uncharacterized protein YfiM (DUF2279 family)
MTCVIFFLPLTSYILSMKSLMITMLLVFSASVSFAQLKADATPIVLAMQANTMPSDTVVTVVPAGKAAAYQNDQWFGSDKLLHFSACGLATLSTAYVLSDKFKFDHTATLIASAGSVLIVGFMKELLDDMNDNNIFSLKDFAADVAGIFVASIIIAIK